MLKRAILTATLLSGCAASSFLFPAASTTQRTPQLALQPGILNNNMKRALPNHAQTLPKPSTFPPKVGTVLSIRGGATTTATTTPTQLKLSPISFDNAPFQAFNTVMFAANAIGFIISIISGGSHKHLDLLGTGAFALAAIPSGLASDIPRLQLSAGCVALWATRLASFLFFRALNLQRDNRLEDTLSTVGGTAAFWVASYLWGVISSLPHSLGTTSSQNIPLLQSPCSMAGACLFVIGFLTETMADYQKWNFKQNHPGKFCNVGLWSISQHPNYLGNILLWSGIFLLNAPALIEPPPATPPTGMIQGILSQLWRFKKVALAALSPLVLYAWFNAQVTGSATSTVELSKQKYGGDPEFDKYVKTVPLLFPNPAKLFSGN